jgi:hypothetical protein
MRTARLTIAVFALSFSFLWVDGNGAVGVPAAFAQPEPGDAEAVIPPGQEPLLSDMLGAGASLPGECKFDGAQAEHTFIRSSYACPGGVVVFELMHPSKAPSEATETSRFGVVLKSGSPPDGLTDALVSRIKAREEAFDWKWIGGTPSRYSQQTIVLAVVVAGLGIAAVVWWLRSRSSQRAQRE